MEWIEIVGYVGVVLSSATFMPQVYQAWKTRSVGDLSIWMIILLLGNDLAGKTIAQINGAATTGTTAPPTTQPAVTAVPTTVAP